MRHMTLPTAFVLLIAMGLLAGGCAASADRQVVESTSNRPANVTVVDAVTDETLWRMEVPVGHYVQLDYDHPGMEREGIRISDQPATQMSWDLHEIADAYTDPQRRIGEAVASGELELTGNAVRTVVTFRQSAAISGEGLYHLQQYRRPDQAAQPQTTPSRPQTQPTTTQPATP